MSFRFAGSFFNAAIMASVFALLAFLTMGAGTAVAATPAFGLPVACTVGEDCVIQNYVDQDPGPGWMDYACGHLSYNGENGTDFRLRDYVAMNRGVAVLAAAAGVVVDVRDGMPDVSIRTGGIEAVRGREAGNRVALFHGDGWLTQYSHLKQGSVAVRKGDRVEAGQRLGDVGLSGSTEFPHVEFLVTYQDRVVDPFVGVGPFPSCHGPRAPLWRADLLDRLAYRPTGILGAGFAGETPDPEKTRWGAYAGPLTRASSGVFFWVDLFGVRRGDSHGVTLTGPDGGTLYKNTATAERDFASAFLAVPAGKPAPGIYSAVYTLRRQGRIILETRRETTIRP